jgi:uncharacterized protein (DUF1778 family)
MELEQKTSVNRSLKLPVELRAEIKEAAEAVGMSSAAFIRLAARNAADQVLTTGCSADEVLSIEKSARLQYSRKRGCAGKNRGRRRRVIAWLLIGRQEAQSERAAESM